MADETGISWADGEVEHLIGRLKAYIYPGQPADMDRLVSLYRASTARIAELTAENAALKAEIERREADRFEKVKALIAVTAQRDAALSRLAEMEGECESARSVLKGYEAWEADLILNGDWRDATPRMTEGQYDKMLELQSLRNSALAQADAKPQADAGGGA